MKILFTCTIAALLFTSTYGQELASKGGLTISYEASKTETTKKADKWTIKILVNNTSGAELYFSGSVSGLTLDAPYVRIDIPNAKGLMATNLDYLRAPLVDGVTTPNKWPVFKIPAGTSSKELTTTVAIGETPVVKGTIMVDPKSLNDITTGSSSKPATTATPAAAAPAADQSITSLKKAGLTSGQKLLIRQSLEMPAYPEIKLVLDATGNLFLSNDGGKTSLWSTNTGGKQVSYAEMQTDGNFVLKTATDEVVWSTDTAGNDGSMVVLGQQGTLVLMSKQMQLLWQAPN